ncbi:MAG: response regulator transcription factor [Cyanobacteriota bacterium]|nr:response regulator transcription factor [Cyanobacteriota bacterium]
MSTVTPTAKVLVADDDARLRDFLKSELMLEGYGVAEAGDGMSALTVLRQDAPDLVILDWQLPDFTGVEICRRLRSTGATTPVLMLTGRDEVRDRVEALDAGADDYLVKPFSIEELLARLRALQRRTAAGATAETASGGGDLITLADLTVNTASREVTRGGEDIRLSVKEYDLLLTLLRSAERVIERQDLLTRVWGETFCGDSNLLDVYIRYLRQKIERPGLPTLVQTVRGVGFMLKPGAVKV